MGNPVHVSQVEPIASLADSTAALRRRLEEHDKAERESSVRRGSVPPSVSRAVDAISAERCREIGRALTSNHAVLTLSQLVGVTPSEFLAFARAAVRGAQP